VTQTQTPSVQKLVTADGTYATQSAFGGPGDKSSTGTSNYKDERVSNNAKVYFVASNCVLFLETFDPIFALLYRNVLH
jgi:hypothetical protein